MWFKLGPAIYSVRCKIVDVEKLYFKIYLSAESDILAMDICQFQIALVNSRLCHAPGNVSVYLPGKHTPYIGPSCFCVNACG